MKKSKIIRVESTKDFTNSHGTTIYHNLEMDNGDKINIGKKSLQQVGWELIYKVVDSGQEYNKAKYVSKEDFENQDGAANKQSNASPQSQNSYSKPKLDTQVAIIYQSTMKEVMSYFNVHGFDLINGGVNTTQQAMDIISDSCKYLAEKTINNITELSK